MTSHVRHRRDGVTPGLIEPGELALSAINRQIVAGDIDAAAGTPLPLIAVRFFDVRASYRMNDFVVQGGSIMRALTDVPPGPFNASQWQVLVGSNADVHTPLHGYSDGANHTLILHGARDDDTTANTVFFNNHSGTTLAQLWTLDGGGGGLRIQSAGKVGIAPNFLGFDDSANVLEVGTNNATIFNHGLNEALVLRNLDDGHGNAIDFRNAAGSSAANLFEYTGKLWVQAAAEINLAPAHTAIDGGGTKLQVNGTGAHVFGALQVDGVTNLSGQVNVGGELHAAGSLFTGYHLTTGPNSEITNTSGYLVVQAADGLYLRSPTAIYMNDTTRAPVYMGGDANVSGVLNVAQNASIHNDLNVFRSYAPTTGLINFGATGSQYLYFDGSDLLASMRISTPAPVTPQNTATKGYVDGQIAALGPFLPLAGGTMTGELISSSAGGDLGIPGASGTVQIRGANEAGMAFHIPGVVATNFGLRNDGNFWFGGWSHASLYKLWSTRDVPLAPIANVRLAFAADRRPDSELSVEPILGAVVTGVALSALVGVGGIANVRYRYLQILVGSTWMTVATA